MVVFKGIQDGVTFFWGVLVMGLELGEMMLEEGWNSAELVLAVDHCYGCGGVVLWCLYFYTMGLRDYEIIDIMWWGWLNK